MTTPSIKKTIRRHTNIELKDQDNRVCKIMSDVAANYKHISEFFKLWDSVKEFESIESRKSDELIKEVLSILFEREQAHQRANNPIKGDDSISNLIREGYFRSTE